MTNGTDPYEQWPPIEGDDQQGCGPILLILALLSIGFWYGLYLAVITIFG